MKIFKFCGRLWREKMTRKTGKALQRARLQMRAAKLARIKRELAEHGVSLRPSKPPKKALKEKEEEIKKLYQELFPTEAESIEEEIEEVIEPKPKKKEKPAEETGGQQQS